MELVEFVQMQLLDLLKSAKLVLDFVQQMHDMLERLEKRDLMMHQLDANCTVMGSYLGIEISSIVVWLGEGVWWMKRWW